MGAFLLFKDCLCAYGVLFCELGIVKKCKVEKDVFLRRRRNTVKLCKCHYSCFSCFVQHSVKQAFQQCYSVNCNLKNKPCMVRDIIYRSFWLVEFLFVVFSFQVNLFYVKFYLSMKLHICFSVLFHKELELLFQILLHTKLTYSLYSSFRSSVTFVVNQEGFSF